jgi:hypothetical protein
MVLDEEGLDAEEELNNASSFSCCSLRKLWAVAVTILKKKVVSMSNMTVFHIEANEKSHFPT